MSTGQSLPYHLRVNKAVEREIWIELLVLLSHSVGLDGYRYVSLGGPFLEDFRLIHSRVGIDDMVCVEADAQVHQRQIFNRPVASLQCVFSTLQDYVGEQPFDDKRTIMWLDFTDPGELRGNIELFAEVAKKVLPGSILKITLNASPSGLGGDPAKRALQLQQERHAKLEHALGNLLPAGVKPEDVTRAGYGPLLLRCVRNALDVRLEGSGVRYAGLCSFHYSDGQPMVTATIAILYPEGDPRDFLEEARIRAWRFYEERWWRPTVIEMPILSALERLRVEQQMHAPGIENFGRALGFALPPGDLSRQADLLPLFRRFYRFYPQFGRVSF